ncbi:hypothetical protein THOB06_110030 [Vibrio rotiferianus]|nr:hypothetical protein THOG10_110030 [Vibrio rotiferianus]CAH1560605.1 hypothetical protein THOB06_110030 [Vibrio rotiferianus]
MLITTNNDTLNTALVMNSHSIYMAFPSQITNHAIQFTRLILGTFLKRYLVQLLIE